MPFISVEDQSAGSNAGLNLRPEVGISGQSEKIAANSKFGPLAASNHPVPAFFHLFFKVGTTQLTPSLHVFYVFCFLRMF
jgi:hypothetical protein